MKHINLDLMENLLSDFTYFLDEDKQRIHTHIEENLEDFLKKSEISTYIKEYRLKDKYLQDMRQHLVNLIGAYYFVQSVIKDNTAFNEMIEISSSVRIVFYPVDDYYRVMYLFRNGSSLSDATYFSAYSFKAFVRITGDYVNTKALGRDIREAFSQMPGIFSKEPEKGDIYKPRFTTEELEESKNIFGGVEDGNAEGV